jgi:hypothetical protein
MLTRTTAIGLLAILFVMSSALAQGKKGAPASFSGRLLEYTANKGTITEITVLQPTPSGKFQQEIYNLKVNKSTKFVVKEGDKTTELDAKTVLTDDKTKEMFTQKAGTTLGNNAGLAVNVETKAGAATTVTLTIKKK